MSYSAFSALACSYMSSSCSQKLQASHLRRSKLCSPIRRLVKGGGTLERHRGGRML